MPTYEYQCQKCKKKFERLQSMTAPPVKKCEFCKGKVVRLISAGAGLIFKGSGFYITDYKKKPDAKPDTKKESEKPKPDTKKPSNSPPPSVK